LFHTIVPSILRRSRIAVSYNYSFDSAAQPHGCFLQLFPRFCGAAAWLFHTIVPSILRRSRMVVSYNYFFDSAAQPHDSPFIILYFYL
jgi:hypothetical protein